MLFVDTRSPVDVVYISRFAGVFQSKTPGLMGFNLGNNLKLGSLLKFGNNESMVPSEQM